ncbi:MAG: hypothetical protein AB7T06_17520 [Kofleriaceae bacterium]
MRSVLVATLLLASHASANPARAWEAARANLPASTKAVTGIDIDTGMSTSLAAFSTPLLATMGASKVLESIQKTCKIDPAKVVDGLVIAEGATADAGAYYISLEGLDEAGLVACANKLAAKKTAEAPAPSVQSDGGVHQLALGDKTFFATWIGADVLVIAAKPGDKAMLRAFTSGKGALAKSPLGKLAAKANTSATVWHASTKSRAFEQTTTKTLRTSLDASNKMLALAMTMTFASAKQAKAVEKLVNDQIIALLASGRLDAIVMEMLNKATVTTNGAELEVNGSIPDGQLLAVIGALKP